MAKLITVTRFVSEITPEMIEQGWVRSDKPIGSEAAQSKDEWISVNERLPKEGGRYWCYVEEVNDLGISHYQWNCSYNEYEKTFSDRYLNGGNVTHWMPLPAAPKKPARVPLFKTEDGVELFEGDLCWCVSVVSNYSINVTKARPELFPAPSYFKYFSQENFAVDYAALNARILSLKDIRQYISGYKEYKLLVAMVKNKITGSSPQ